MNIKQYFKKAYVINLDGSKDRMQLFLQRAAEAGVTGFTRTQAVDGRVCKPPAWWPSGEGAWGCMMSHQKIAQDALMRGLENYVVFEDDAVFSDDFTERLPQVMESLDKLDGNWDMFYLGGQHLVERGQPFPIHGTDLLKCVNINRTHALAVNARVFLKFSQHIIHAPDYIENASKGYTMHLDHQLGELHPYISCIAPDQWLCGQAEGRSTIESKTNREMWWHLNEDNVTDIRAKA